MIISISDVQNFQRCRRKWNYQSPNQRSLVKAGMPRNPFVFGDMIHKHLDFHMASLPNIVSKGGMSVKIGTWLLKKIKEYDSDYKEVVGCGLSDQETQSFFDNADKASSIYKNYVNHWGNDCFEGFECIGIEQEFYIPIPKSPGDYFVGTLDKVFLKDDHLYLVDHKTYTKAKNYDQLHPNLQFRAYSWVASMLFPQVFKGFIYDGILKQAPVLPDILKSGKLSKSKKQWTTAKLYKEAINNLELKPKDYESIVKHYETRQKDFFNRITLDYTQEYLDEIPHLLRSVVKDMKEEINKPQELKYMPSVPFLGCIDCDFKQACYLQSTGKDFESHLSNVYKYKLYGTFKNLKGKESNSEV